MHPGSANDVSANADERKNTTVRSALRALNFFFSCSSRDTLKIIYSFFLPNSHTDTKIRRKHAHVKNDASTSTHFHAHPYTRKRIRDCNLNVLNMSHKNTCILHINILSTYFLGRGFVCLQKKRRYYRRTTNDIEREKDTNERRNMIEEELAPLTRTRSHRRWIAIIFTRTSFPRFFLKEKKQRKNLTGREAAILF